MRRATAPAGAIDADAPGSIAWRAAASRSLARGEHQRRGAPQPGGRVSRPRRSDLAARPGRSGRLAPVGAGARGRSGRLNAEGLDSPLVAAAADEHADPAKV